MTPIPELVNAERRSLFADLQDLDAAQWSLVTTCDPWTVREVVAHMTAVGSSGTVSFVGGLIRSRFDFAEFAARGLREFNDGSNADVLHRFGETIESSDTPPGPRYIVLGEIMCHGEDIRRVAGLPGGHREESLIALADGYRLAPAPIGGRKRAKGLRLTATDIEWSRGDGPEVSGPAIDLILALTGRAEALATCSGEGLETLRDRGR